MMTSRQRLEDEASGVHEQVDAMLDSEDSIIILMDARRAIKYVRGFGLSACQLELLATDIERLVRIVTRTQPSREEKERYDQGTGMDGGTEHGRGAYSTCIQWSWRPEKTVISRP
jgi:hypothetical protein